MASDLIPPDMPEPLDDTGSDTFARFRYQAKLAVPFALRCALGMGEIVAVIPEHFEDLAIELRGGWRFLQIKTRDMSLPRWRLSDLLDANGGALHALHRTYQQTRGQKATYEMMLEGASYAHPKVRALARVNRGSITDWLSQLTMALGIDEEEAQDFLSRVRLSEAPPPREYVDAYNLRLLAAQAPTLANDTIETIYKACVARIEEAMAAEPQGAQWPGYCGPIALGMTPYAQLLAQKRLTPEICGALFGPLLKTVRPFVLKELDESRPRPTALELKLLAGGASETTVENAIRLRANATIAEIERFNSKPVSGSAGVSDDPEFEDLRIRLKARADAVAAAWSGAEAPADKIWNDLMSRLMTEASQLDPNSVFGRDAMLLLGEVCELSDLCLCRWGGPHG